MDSYKFTLEDYHAIKKAEIILDGMTVLAGLNGCGKSTISRWLYGFVRFSNDFDRIVDAETAEAVFERTKKLTEILRRIAFINKSSRLPSFPKFSGQLDIEVAAFQERLATMSQSKLENNEREYIANEEKLVVELLHDAERRKQDCSLADLYRMIEVGLDLKSKAPNRIQFSENGTDLIDREYEYITKDGVQLTFEGMPLVTGKILGRFLAPMGLKRAIYIDSPMSISNHDGDSFKLWSDLRKMLSTPLNTMPEAGRRIEMEISLILGGEIMLKDEGIGRKELRYVRRADGLDISIDEVATGMKSFAYLLRLLQNGYIDSQTLLIIDEPEAHLHPQWIVKFAKMLVLIQKLLGAKVMVASHDPDMVAAIQTMAEAEGLAEVTNFYQATKKPDELQYTYEDSGNDISRIFESFNIALDRIDGYKASDAS